MTAMTYTQHTGAKPGTPFGGWLVRIFERMVESQAARVRKEVHAQLRGFSEATLRDIGFNAADIKRLRAGKPVGYPG